MARNMALGLPSRFLEKLRWCGVQQSHKLFQAHLCISTFISLLVSGFRFIKAVCVSAGGGTLSPLPRG